MTITAPNLVVDIVGVSKTFPGVRALDDVSFNVVAGEVHALVGKNGAGKSTLMHLLTGLYAPDHGSITVRGKRYDRFDTAQAKEAGVAIVAQHARFVPGLSIAENIFCGALPLRKGGFVDWPRVYAEAEQRLHRMGLTIDVRRRIETTSVAERQMIEIARALFVDASVIILDEPTAALPKHEVSLLFEFVRRQKADGASFIYISHYLEEVFEVADRATVLRNGRVVASKPIRELTQPELIRMISGTTVEQFRRTSLTPGAPVLELRNITRPRAYHNITLTLHAGEVVGLTGLEGSGAAALARSLFGIEPLGSGETLLDGRPFHPNRPDIALSDGLAYVPRDRHGLGIVGPRSVRENISLSVLDRLTGPLGLIEARRERALVQGYIGDLGIVAVSMATPVESLSGGNQQKVVVAKLAATKPRVLLLDEPTQGVDVQAKVEILRIIDSLTKQGVAVAVISDELSELIDISDRILVFHRGSIRREFRRSVDTITTEILLQEIEGGTLQ
jgi:ABC-type sugar transport system ATPase subunit